MAKLTTRFVANVEAFEAMDAEIADLFEGKE